MSAGLFNGDALVMLEGVLAVADMQVRDIMVPRSQMVFVERDEPPEKLVELVVESGHSRFPVIGEDRDQILGILLAKDLLRLQTAADEHFEIREFMRPVVFVPESKRLNVLLKEFRRSHNHIAMVVDEYGGVCGLVTIEDVIEQIVGEIDDEHDVEDDQTIRRGATARIHACARSRRSPISTQYFGTAFSDEEYDTIGGLLMQEFGTPAAPRRNHQNRRAGVSHPARRSAPHRFVARDHSLRHRAARCRRVRCLKHRMRGLAAAFRNESLARLMAAFAAGRRLNLGFAPFGWWPLALLAPAALFALIRGLPPRRAGWTGAAFGAGLFAFGTYWLYTCLHVFGLVPVWLTLRAADGAGCGLMSAYPAALCFLANRFWLKPGATRDWLVLPSCGCCWNGCAAGCSAAFHGCRWAMRSSTPRSAGWAPLLGVYGVTWAAAHPPRSALNRVFASAGMTGGAAAAGPAVHGRLIVRSAPLL